MFGTIKKAAFWYVSDQVTAHVLLIVRLIGKG